MKIFLFNGVVFLIGLLASFVIVSIFKLQISKFLFLFLLSVVIYRGFNTSTVISLCLFGVVGELLFGFSLGTVVLASLLVLIIYRVAGKLIVMPPLSSVLFRDYAAVFSTLISSVVLYVVFLVAHLFVMRVMYHRVINWSGFAMSLTQSSVLVSDGIMFMILIMLFWWTGNQKTVHPNT